MTRPFVLIFEDDVSDVVREQISRGVHRFLELANLGSLSDVYYDYELWRFLCGHRRLPTCQDITAEGTGMHLDVRSEGETPAATAYRVIYAERIIKTLEKRFSTAIIPIFVTTLPLFHEYFSRFIWGAAREGVGAVITTDGFAVRTPARRRHYMETLVLHELGHVFGLVPQNRTYAVEERFGRHCTNRCVMHADWFDGKCYMHAYQQPFCLDCHLFLNAWAARHYRMTQVANT